MKEGGPLLKASYSLMCLYFIKASLKNVVHETDTFFLEKKNGRKKRRLTDFKSWKNCDFSEVLTSI